METQVKVVQKRRPRSPKISVNVTEEIIKESTLRDSSHCMIAEAVRAAYPDAQRVSVDLQTIRLSDPKKGLRYTYLTPRTGQVALIRFDQGELPEPFTMQLRGGQVTTANPKKNLGTDAQKKRFAETQAQREQRRAALDKARLVSTNGERDGTVIERVGGKTPPLSTFARRREFGLRGLNR